MNAASRNGRRVERDHRFGFRLDLVQRHRHLLATTKGFVIEAVAEGSPENRLGEEGWERSGSRRRIWRAGNAEIEVMEVEGAGAGRAPCGSTRSGLLRSSARWSSGRTFASRWSRICRMSLKPIGIDLSCPRSHRASLGQGSPGGSSVLVLRRESLWFR